MITNPSLSLQPVNIYVRLFHLPSFHDDRPSFLCPDLHVRSPLLLGLPSPYWTPTSCFTFWTRLLRWSFWSRLPTELSSSDSFYGASYNNLQPNRPGPANCLGHLFL